MDHTANKPDPIDSKATRRGGFVDGVYCKEAIWRDVEYMTYEHKSRMTTLKVFWVATRCPGSPSHVRDNRVMIWAIEILSHQKAQQREGWQIPKEKQSQSPSFHFPVGAWMRSSPAVGGIGVQKVSPSSTPPSGYPYTIIAKRIETKKKEHHLSGVERNNSNSHSELIRRLHTCIVEKRVGRNKAKP